VGKRGQSAESADSQAQRQRCVSLLPGRCRDRMLAIIAAMSRSDVDSGHC
jgi:hypothetical protein